MRLKYVGREPTRTFIEQGKNKVDIKPNEIFTCEESFGINLLKQYGRVFKKVPDLVKPKRRGRPKKVETQELKNKETA